MNVVAADRLTVYDLYGDSEFCWNCAGLLSDSRISVTICGPGAAMGVTRSCCGRDCAARAIVDANEPQRTVEQAAAASRDAEDFFEGRAEL